MKEVVLSLPTFGFIIATRAALGVGIGLLLSEKLPAQRRKAIGAVLVAIGATATIPAIVAVRRSVSRAEARSSGEIGRDSRLVGTSRFPRKGDDDLF